MEQHVWLRKAERGFRSLQRKVLSSVQLSTSLSVAVQQMCLAHVLRLSTTLPVPAVASLPRPHCQGNLCSHLIPPAQPSTSKSHSPPHISHSACPGPHCIIIYLSTMFYKMSLACPQPGSPHPLPSPKSHFTREQLHLLLPSCFDVVCLAAALRAATGAAQATR